MKTLAPLLVLLAGCDLYFGGGDDEPPPPCYDYATGGGGAIAPLELRNPYTGECESFGGQYPCDDRCGPCPAYDTAEPAPNWGQCYSQCDALDEYSCLGTAGCQAAYETKEGPTPDGQTGYAFLGCWATAGGYPNEPANCSALDAESCSTRDTCSMNYVTRIAPDDGLERGFSHCSAEGGSGTVCYSDAECTDSERCTAGYEECNPPPGCDPNQGCPAVCAGHCVPKQTSCSNIDCGPGSHCEEQCSMGPNGETYCEPICVQDATCAAVDCGPGYHCVETCTDPNPMDPTAPGCGQCYPQCVPDSNPASCAEITDEMTCYSRGDCQAVYQGDDCTCYPDGCTCNVLTYDRCETRGSTMPSM